MMTQRAFLYTMAFVAGAAVLAIEILGTRILGPFYGVSIFLWSALIAITLAALSLGYAVGGRWADKGATLKRLCYIVGGAALWILLIPWLKYPVLEIAEPLGLRAAVLVATFALFFIPLALLGMVSPFAVKLRTSSIDEVGRSAGNLYALSTIGSVLSALLTGFVLIPNVGVHRLLIMIGLLLLATAAVGIGLGGKSIVRRSLPPGLFLAGALLWLVSPADSANPGLGVITVRQSPYGEIRVVDTEYGRHLLIDGGIHTIVDTSTWQSLFPYTAVMDIPLYLRSQPGKMLLIGLGGGSLAKRYSSAGWNVDAVEIDPVVTEFAYTYFGLDSSDARVYQMDGRQFLIANEQRYDVILVDAFGSSSIPFHLVTKESFGLIVSRLAPDGIVAINLESLGWRHKIVFSVAATLKEHFDHVVVLPMAEPPNTLGNIILLASRGRIELQRELPRDHFDPSYRFGPQYHRNHAWDNQFTAPTDGIQIFTDDLNPVDVWSEAINFVARKRLHEYFKEERVSW